MDETTGLRERKKAQTRSAISTAVMLLALERGLDAVTADDIAAAANVSVRTFHNYFGSKEEALIASWRSEFEVHLEELRARPPDEPILVSLECVLAGIAALGRFKGVKRRMELRGEVNGVRVFDDFAHHPTAIATTLQGLRRRVGGQRILAVLEPRSNTMRLGVHNAELAASLDDADRVFLFAPPDLGWDAAGVFAGLGPRAEILSTVEAMVARIATESRQGDQVLVMSNGGFGGIHQKLLDALSGPTDH